jgi:predicted Ser/Thr protein kinase/tetratricopeptide (TPR) repeat protein
VTLATHPEVEAPRPSGLPRCLVEDARFRVIGELGRGGMGAVFSALNRETGERVAIKVLSSRREGLLRFKNEFRLASRLTHPNLVALYDLVISDEAAYFVMEYAPGVDLRRWVRDKKRANLQRLHASALQIIDALECLGAAGIVHRDLKPSNVLVSDEGRVKLLDFGLAGAPDTPDFSAAMLAGTPTYMAPEQIAGQKPTPASDLYSLGVMVYELLVGEPPFIGRHHNVLHAHRHQFPLPPSERVDHVPPDLEEWCLRLLAKRPEERFASAEEARRALERCELSGAVTERTPRDWVTAGSGSHAALADKKLFGRDSERALLEALLDRAAEGGCHMALITGEAGVGKTALGEALLAAAEERGCLTLRGACRENESLPYNAFDEVVDAAASLVERRLRDGEIARAELGEVSGDLPLLARLFPVLRELAALSGAPLPDEHTRSADRERAFGLLKQVVERVSRARPVVLLLDDLHWADADSLALLEFLLAPPGTAGLLVVATARPVGPETGALARFVEAHRGLRLSGEGLTQIALGPLAVEEGMGLVRALGGEEVGALDAALIQREAAGNPALLVELTRICARDRNAPVPSVGDLLKRRLGLLDADERALVELIAVAGDPTGAALLKALAERASPPVALDSKRLRRLCKLRVLRELDARRAGPGEARYTFYHRRLRDTVRAELPEDERRGLHLRLAEALAQVCPGDHDAQVRELLLAGEEARAAGHAEAAAEAAMARLAHARAVELYDLALRHAAGRDAERLHVRMGQALEGVGRFDAAAEHYRVALAGTLLAGTERTLVELRLASALMHLGDLETSTRLMVKGLGALGHQIERRPLARAFTLFGLFLRFLFSEWFRRPPRKRDDLETEARLTAYGLAVPHFQFTSQNVLMLEYALRFRLLGARSPVAETRQEAHATALMLMIPFASRSRLVRRRMTAHFGRLEAGAPRMASMRGRVWLPLMRALWEMVSGRPDRAIPHFDELRDTPVFRTGYLALQRHNAYILAGAYDRYVDDVAGGLAYAGPLQPLEIARLAYVERVRGHRETARRLMEDIAHVDPGDLPWTHRSLFTYQLVELHLAEGDSARACALARHLLPRIRRAAVSPTTGAHESVDAVARAFLAEAARLARAGERKAARALIAEAERAVRRAPLLAPPLFAARLSHDRALVEMARGRDRAALDAFLEAERLSRGGHVPCFRFRLLEDLALVLPEGHPLAPPIEAELDEMTRAHRYARRG